MDLNSIGSRKYFTALSLSIQTGRNWQGL